MSGLSSELNKLVLSRDDLFQSEDVFDVLENFYEIATMLKVNWDSIKRCSECCELFISKDNVVCTDCSLLLKKAST